MLALLTSAWTTHSSGTPVAGSANENKQSKAANLRYFGGALYSVCNNTYCILIVNSIEQYELFERASSSQMVRRSWVQPQAKLCVNNSD
jgi:uncharacterized protein YlbG (UPF0298 family)